MPDISMCLSNDCILAGSCFRNAKSGTKPSFGRQAYGDFTPVLNKDETCKYYGANTHDAPKG